MTDPIAIRYAAAQTIAREAGALAKRYFDSFDALTIHAKGHQDFVSEADRNVEILVREAIIRAFPDDAIVGEEDAPRSGISGFTWVIDPIDGTTNFIHGIPGWTVVIALAQGGECVAGVIHDPVHDEMHHTTRGGGAFCNDRPIRVLSGRSLQNGSLGVGYSGRVPDAGIINLVRLVVEEGGIFYRNGSGALSLALVASGRLLGYVEQHMNAWDCLAGLLLVEEAGGRVEAPDPATVLRQGCRVIAATADLYDEVLDLSDRAFG
ncbi:MAG: inositol monophosphatase family protein [Pseudorhodobacter sp.]